MPDLIRHPESIWIPASALDLIQGPPERHKTAFSGFQGNRFQNPPLAPFAKGDNGRKKAD
jgi:hypothetical protein